MGSARTWRSGSHPATRHVFVDRTTIIAKELCLTKRRVLAERYLGSLPARDRVMLVRVDGLTTPVTSFSSDRAQVLNAVHRSSPGFSALNIGQALSFARHARSWSGGRAGEIAYIGPQLIEDGDSVTPNLPNLRVIAVEPGREHCGIRANRGKAKRRRRKTHGKPL